MKNKSVYWIIVDGHKIKTVGLPLTSNLTDWQKDRVIRDFCNEHFISNKGVDVKMVRCNYPR